MRFPRTIEEAASQRAARSHRGRWVTRQIVQVPAVQCAWCKCALSEDRCAPDMVSHGICLVCAGMLKSELGRGAE